MAYEYQITESAQKDIDDVVNYIVNKLSNIKAATDLLNDIEKSIKNAIEFPFSYSNCSYYYIFDDNVRHIIIGNYILIYKIDKTKLYFTRFRYSKQNKIL